MLSHYMYILFVPVNNYARLLLDIYICFIISEDDLRWSKRQINMSTNLNLYEFLNSLSRTELKYFREAEKTIKKKITC